MIACGVYNLLKTSKSMPMSNTNLLNNDHLEANLNTMFQSVRGGEAKSAMNNLCDINANAKSDDLTLQERIAMLNTTR